jgi:phage terminase small subunit
MGWKEPKQEVGHSGAVGSYDLSKLSDDELKRVEAILSRAAISGPAGVPGGDSET